MLRCVLGYSSALSPSYLLRPELITLHEADAAYTANSARGVQIYTECVQILVGGNGTVSLPPGVAFPGGK